jgi:hypothetical protein
MSYEKAVSIILAEEGVELSTMMKTPCIRYRGDFLAMMFDKENALIIKVAPERVNELIREGKGREFNFTKKRFKKWVLIDQEYEKDYGVRLQEALEYAKSKR